MMETLLVPNNLNGHRMPSAMIATVQHLSERAFTKGIDDLVTIVKVVPNDNLVVASVVVISVVVSRDIESGVMLLAGSAEVVHRGVILNLLLFVLREILGLTTSQDG